MQAMISPSEIEPTQMQNEDCFAISCFQHIMKSNIALNDNTRKFIIDLAKREVIQGKMSIGFYNSLFPNDVN
jgi:hypothetical protein